MAPLCNEEGDAIFYTEEESPAEKNQTSLSMSISSVGGESSSPIETPPVGRSVSFSSEPTVHCGAVMDIEEYSDNEKFDCWYNSDELRRFRRVIKKTVALMNRNVSFDAIARKKQAEGREMTITTHGLEGYTRVGKQYRKESRFATMAAVFDEQTIQEVDGVFDPVMIAMASIEYSFPSQIAALKRASRHQKHVEAILQNSESEENYQSLPDRAFVSYDTSSSDDTASIEAEFHNYSECQSTIPSVVHFEPEESDSIGASELDSEASPNASLDDPIRNNNEESYMFLEHEENGFIEEYNMLLKNEENNKSEESNMILDYCEKDDSMSHPCNIGPLTATDKFSCQRMRSLAGGPLIVRI